MKLSLRHLTSEVEFTRVLERMSELLNGLVEDDGEDVEEEDVTPEPCLCLFCSAVQPSALVTLDHCKTEHGVDLLLIATELGGFFKTETPCVLMYLTTFHRF